MSRHRDFRNRTYSEEYDCYEDNYGHSMDDHELGVSPSTASLYLVDRNSRHANLSNYIPSPIQEYPREETDYCTPSNRINTLDETLDYQNRLTNCIDEIVDIAGDVSSLEELKTIIVQNNFDVERVISELNSPRYSRTRNDSDEAYENVERHKFREKVEKHFQSAANSNQDINIKKQCDNGDVLTTFTQMSSLNISSSEKNREKSPDLRVPDVNASSITATPNSQKLDDTTKREKYKREFNESYNTPEDKRSSRKAVIEALNRRKTEKEQLNLVVIGHVDAGKSTLMGHLLYKLGNVDKKTMQKNEHDSKKLGKSSFAFAWVLDETGEERTRGITMDVAITNFDTKSKSITLLDAPGHRDFIPNMITGASQADVAVLVVDSSTNGFESGFEQGGQTREHTILVRSLGVTQMIVVVNKLDMVDWAEDRFREIVDKLRLFLLKHVGFRESDVVYVPCSGLTGDNLTDTSDEVKLTRWYKGLPLVEYIDRFKPPQRPVDAPLRLCVGDIFKGSSGSGISVAGKIASGTIQSGDKVFVLPSGELCLVKNLMLRDSISNVGCAGDNCVVVLSNIDPTNLSIGSVVCHPESPIPCAMCIQARILVFQTSATPIIKGAPVIFHYQSLNEPAVVDKLISMLSKTTGEVLKSRPRCICRGANAVVVVRLMRSLCVETYKNNKELGRFMLRSNGSTIAGGVITEILK